MKSTSIREKSSHYRKATSHYTTAGDHRRNGNFIELDKAESVRAIPHRLVVEVLKDADGLIKATAHIDIKGLDK